MTCEMPDAAVNAANAADSLSLVVQDAGLLKLIVNYLGEVHGFLVHLSALPGTNAVLLRDLDRHAELTRVLRDTDELQRDFLTASHRQAHGNDGSAMAATRSRVRNSSTTLSTLPINTVEALSLVGMSTLHWLFEESQQLHGHAHVLPLGKVLRALEQALARGPSAFPHGEFACHSDAHWVLSQMAMAAAFWTLEKSRLAVGSCAAVRQIEIASRA